MLPYLIEELKKSDIRIPYRSVIPHLATDDQIYKELYKLTAMQTRVFVVHMSPSIASLLFLKAKEQGMMSEGYVWIITDGLSNVLSSMDSAVIDSMQGVLGIRPYIPRSKERDSFRPRWRRQLLQANPDVETASLSVSELWAYDKVWALALAIEEVGRVDSHFTKPTRHDNSSDLTSIEVSQIGPELLQAILKTTFKGLSEEFTLVGGQLQAFTFQILNVISDGVREVVFWTPASGILPRSEVNRTSRYLISKANLGIIIWPGDSTVVPKGWAIPTDGKYLKIGVPVKEGFTSVVSGYCIDMFKAAIEILPYAVLYEFAPFLGTYNELIDQVYLQNYDAMVGDVTVIANRSLYVDFIYSSIYRYWQFDKKESEVQITFNTVDQASLNVMNMAVEASPNESAPISSPRNSNGADASLVSLEDECNLSVDTVSTSQDMSNSVEIMPIPSTDSERSSSLVFVDEGG
ncbi:hypothetical protein GIB67_018618 [Kingdonia uniflora]|uniref:Receptor ligand binding region domain-containing protein n=1 Tax=Kingdonia uniflora TaxID=39325 RepID=A0A7J7M2I2_9MAGN|nr:hypothetical protein GIB67_018618 [Kingdonia uniflora]